MRYKIAYKKNTWYLSSQNLLSNINGVLLLLKNVTGPNIRKFLTSASFFGSCYLCLVCLIFS